MPAQFVRCRHNDVDGEANLPAAAVARGHFPGWAPVDPDAALPSLADGPIDQVLAAVGDDPVKAAAALEAERAGKNRKGLVEPLTALIDSQES